MLAARSHAFVLLRLRPLSRTLASGASSAVEPTDDELREARSWLGRFNAETIPRSICDFSFSRSSGPGGQNVNKVNSKATLKISLAALQPLIPRLVWHGIVNSRYATQSHELVIQADDDRKQQNNVQSCLKKLNEVVAQAGRDAVPGETSDAQKNRVKAMQKSANESRLKTKKFKSDKKSSRRSGRSEY